MNQHLTPKNISGFVVKTGLLLLMLVGSINCCCLYAQTPNQANFNEPTQNYLSIQYQQQKREGAFVYSLFHDTRATNLPLHQHYVYYPFDTATEIERSLNLQAQYFLNKRTSLNISLPYLIKQRFTSDTLHAQATGIGDVWLRANYHVFNSYIMRPNSSIKHLLTVGGGLKLPTGGHQNFIDSEQEPHLQLGSGSWFFEGNANYLLHYQRLTAQATAAYQYTRPNQFSFHFGNNWYVGGHIHYAIGLSATINLSPAIGWQYQHFQQDELNGTAVPEFTQRSVHWLQPALALQVRKILLTAAYSVAVQQQFTGIQADYINRWTISWRYIFASPAMQKPQLPTSNRPLY